MNVFTNLKFEKREGNKVFEPGFLTELYTTVKVKTAAKDSKYKKLDEGDLARLVEIYASIPPDTDLLTIEDDSSLTTPEGNKVTGKDLNSMLRLVYDFPRGTYARINQTKQNTYSAGVPLGLLAYRNYYKIPYNNFRPKPDWFEVRTIDKDKKPIRDIRLKNKHFLDMLRLDLLLGKGLASTIIKGSNVEVAQKYGLGMLCADFNLPEYTISTIQKMRPDTYYINAQYPTSWSVKLLQRDEWHEGYGTFIDLYNRVNDVLKNMLLQKWIYYDCKNSNIITDYRDWDTPIKKADDLPNIITQETEDKPAQGIFAL